MLPLAVCAIILRRRRMWDGAQRLFWDAFAVSMLLWVVGQAGFLVQEIAQGQPAWVGWHTMFSLCGGIGPMIAVLSRPDRGVRKEQTAALAIDLAGFALLAGFIYAYFVMVPSVATDGGNSERVLLTLVEAHRVLLAGAFALSAWLGRRSNWAPTYSRIAIGTGLGLGLRVAANGAISSGSYYAGSPYDLAWIVPYLAFAWAAIEAPASPRAREGTLDLGVSAPSVLFSAIPVFFIPMLGFAVLKIAPLGDPGDAFRVLLTTLATVTGLGLLTLRLSVQSGELQRADERVKLLAAAIEQTGDLILITRADGSVEHGNEACLRALGYSREELAGKNLAELLEAGFEPMVDHIGREVRRQGIWRGTLLHRRADGTSFPASSTVVALRDSAGQVTHFVGVQRDITEELRLRDQLVHSERLAAVGELVAGVAHEINNPLQTIIGSVELLLEDPAPAGDEARTRQDLTLVRQEAARAGQIVRNLLAFVRRSSPDRAAGDLNLMVRAMLDLREYQLAQRNISLAVHLQPGALPVLANKDEIQQVILNLVLNAEQAIGTIRDHGSIVVRTGSLGSMHYVEVSDDGPGIPADLRGRVFEPFFTTKDVGQGTGLGLSIALGIANSHGGSLELCDERESGACFRLLLPAHAVAVKSQAAAVTAPLVSQPAAGAPARGTALVIEDEDPVRNLLVRLLQRRGYAVREASSCAAGRRALDGASFDLVMCDLRLADGNGAECIRHLRSTESDAPVIFVTGDASALGPAAAEFTGVPVLPKPFTIADLDRALSELSPSTSSS